MFRRTLLGLAAAAGLAAPALAFPDRTIRWPSASRPRLD
jgi:hypothetical protein